MDLNPPPKLLLRVKPGRGASKEWVLQEDNIADIFDPIEDLPVAVITIMGPPNKGKSVLFANIARYLDRAENHDPNWNDPQEPIEQTKWPDNLKKEAGIWSYHKTFKFPNNSGRPGEMAVLLLYVNSFENNFWDTENHDICALHGLSLAISSNIVINAYKQLSEDCLHAISLYLRYAAKGVYNPAVRAARDKRAPFQDITFLVRDWRFPSNEYSYGDFGGEKYVKKKLQEKKEHSRKSRQSRKIIKGLFQNVSGILLPYPGNQYIQSTYSHDEKVHQGDENFEENLKSAVVFIAQPDKLNLKTDAYNHELNGRVLRGLIEDFVKKQRTIGDKIPSTGEVLNMFGIQYKVSFDEQKECLGIALQAYLDEWRKREGKGHKTVSFFDNKSLTVNHRKAYESASNALEQEIYEDDEEADFEVDREVWRLLKQRVDSRLKQIKQDNMDKKIAVMKQQILNIVHQYEKDMEITFPAANPDLTEHFVKSHSHGTRMSFYEEFVDKFFPTGADEAGKEENQVLQSLQDKLAGSEELLLQRLFQSL